MRILNLYAGIGGNRKLWGDDHDITAVEYNKDIAGVYGHFFPNDNLVIDDAHNYLLNHFKEYDFIWSSPPCQSHSGTNHFLKGQGIYRYPDMKLWQEIIFLQHFCECKWVIENVKSYYNPIIPPQTSGRHYFWANFKIPHMDYKTDIGTMNRKASKGSQRKAIIREAQIPEYLDLHDLEDFKLKNKRQVLRNCVLPRIGLQVFEAAQNIYKNRTHQTKLFDHE